MIESAVQNVDHFQELFEMVKLFYKKFESFNHHLLCQNHHDFVFESFADNHVSDCGGNKFFIKLFLISFRGEELFEVFDLVGKPYPAISIKNIRYVLELISEGDLVDFIEFIFHGFMIKWISLQSLDHILFVPLRKQLDILH